jgi:hypothetical protein
MDMGDDKSDAEWFGKAQTEVLLLAGCLKVVSISQRFVLHLQAARNWRLLESMSLYCKDSA